MPPHLLLVTRSPFADDPNHGVCQVGHNFFLASPSSLHHLAKLSFEEVTDSSKVG